jgi:hypothetical protein
MVVVVGPTDGIVMVLVVATMQRFFVMLAWVKGNLATFGIRSGVNVVYFL